MTLNLDTYIPKAWNVRKSNNLKDFPSKSIVLCFMDVPLNTQSKNVDKLELASMLGPCASMHGLGPCLCLAKTLILGPKVSQSP